MATAVAYALFARGLSAVRASTTVTLSLAEPLTASALGILLLGERPTTFASVGMGLMMVALASLALDRNRP
jgi:DME family drug/metabolite transporter